jgi:hypothetical protein
MNVVHITLNEGLSAVYPSQVLRPMSLVAKRTGARVNLLVNSPLGDLVSDHEMCDATTIQRALAKSRCS